jgi:hypothetical protein
MMRGLPRWSLTATCSRSRPSIGISPKRYAYSRTGSIGFGFTPFGAAHSAISSPSNPETIHVSPGVPTLRFIRPPSTHRHINPQG